MAKWRKLPDFEAKHQEVEHSDNRFHVYITHFRRTGQGKLLGRRTKARST